MVRDYTRHEIIAGCSVVEDTGLALLIVCPKCHLEFSIRKLRAEYLESVKKEADCPECCKERIKRLNRSRANCVVKYGPSPGRPQMIVGLLMQGHECLDVARRFGIAVQSVERYKYRYVIPRKLQDRIEELERENAALKRELEAMRRKA